MSLLTPPAQPYRITLTCDLQEPEQCSREMLQLLLARLGDVRAAPLTRSAAAAYAGSFLARAAFVPPPLVVSAVQVLQLSSSADDKCTVAAHACCQTPCSDTVNCRHPADELLCICSTHASGYQGLEMVR